MLSRRKLISGLAVAIPTLLLGRKASATARTLTQTVATATSTAKSVLSSNPNRNYLSIENIGSNDVSIGFNGNVIAGGGIVLSPGAPGNQGGSFLWDGPTVPSNEIWIISASGSTVLILEG